MPLKILALVTFVLFVQDASSVNIRKFLFGNSTCTRHQYTCLNDKCISRNLFCNSRDDCGDNSDELYCDTPNSCPSTSHHFRCASPFTSSYGICIPFDWLKDGIRDCANNADEKYVYRRTQELTALDLVQASILSKNWIIEGRKYDRKIQKWGLDLPRIAVALYISFNRTYFHEIAYELSSDFLFKLALKKMSDVKIADIASYVNAFLATCIDPRQFYALDLVKELRTKVDNMNSTNPFAVLTLCNAKELVTERDVQKLEEAFWIAHEKHRIDTMAMIVLALSCASTQSGNVVDKVDLHNFVFELKKQQHRNGTVENVKSTALVMQAILASEREPDEDNFDEKKAIQQILRSQKADGSFGGLANTYYALPVLYGLSLVNISSEHCPSFIRDDNEGLQNLKDQVGEKLSVKYSFWIGEDKFIQRTLTIKVPKNTSFFGVMEYASALDVSFRFECNVRNRKPFIYSLYRFMDDPEKEMFWSFNHLINETSGEVKTIYKSPADIYPKNDDHWVYWYKSEA